MAKKKFDLDPIKQFITPIEEPSREAIPEGYKINPLYVEKRSRRLQLLIQPSLYAKLKAKADMEGWSVNDTLHTILEKALREVEQ